jgi:hypothetical protein
MTWAATEFESIDLGDSWLNKRAMQLTESLGSKPTASIPHACGDWADTLAAYRFFGNKAVKPADILAPHIQSSIARMAQHPVVLCIQDTTELNFNGQQAQGLGPLSYETQRGMYLHPTYAVTTLREPLGVLDAWMWTREPVSADGIRPGPKESLRWISGYKNLARVADQLPDTHLVYMADREADFMELLVCARELGNPVNWLIRSQHNRVLDKDTKLWAAVTSTEPVGEICFVMPRRKNRRARKVVQEVWAKAMQLPDGQGGFVSATCLVAKEKNPPPGEEPIEWRLLTNLPVESLEQATCIIDWYLARWEIEMFIPCLSGCFPMSVLFW